MSRSVPAEGRAVGVNGRSVVRGSAIPDGLVDNFEDANASPPGVYETGDDISTFYTAANGSIGDWERSTTDVINDSKSLRFTNTGADLPLIASDDGDGLNDYPQKGDVFRSYLKTDANENNPACLFGVNISNDTGYAVVIGNNRNEIQIDKVTSLSSPSVSNLATADDSGSLTISDGAIYELEVEWHDGSGSENDNTIVLRIFDVDQSTLARGSELAQASATDSDYATQTGVGWYLDSNGVAAATIGDGYKITGSV